MAHVWTFLRWREMDLVTPVIMGMEVDWHGDREVQVEQKVGLRVVYTALRDDGKALKVETRCMDSITEVAAYYDVRESKTDDNGVVWRAEIRQDLETRRFR